MNRKARDSERREKDIEFEHALAKKIADEGEPLYTKSKWVADDCTLSSNEVGARIRRIREGDSFFDGSFDIEAWGPSCPITWKISFADDGQRTDG